jgi:hypothetical protein
VSSKNGPFALVALKKLYAAALGEGVTRKFFCEPDTTILSIVGGGGSVAVSFKGAITPNETARSKTERFILQTSWSRNNAPPHKSCQADVPGFAPLIVLDIARTSPG